MNTKICATATKDLNLIAEIMEYWSLQWDLFYLSDHGRIEDYYANCPDDILNDYHWQLISNTFYYDEQKGI